MPYMIEQQRRAIHALVSELIDHERARVIVQPNQPADGYWFGGGSLIQDLDGTLWLSGRYRDVGDSRTGVGAGLRGLECALFSSGDCGASFEKVKSWSKADLSANGTVLSIEGTDLRRAADGGIELYVSLEKDVAYPDAYSDFKKPGTGVWSIDWIAGEDPTSLDLGTQTTVLRTDRPESLHVKDPVTFTSSNGVTVLMFCSHPVSWASSNTGYVVRAAGSTRFELGAWEAIRRGAIWDVAVTRVTDRLAVPPLGLFRRGPPTSIFFYDGAECMRPLEENPRAAKRPRGYSCEELGGALWGKDSEFPVMERLSRVEPLFVSPTGTGSSRYVSTLVTSDAIYATWQQSQADQSQPLMMNVIPMDRVEAILGGATP